jgi:hypothetical protein
MCAKLRMLTALPDRVKDLMLSEEPTFTALRADNDDAKRETSDTEKPEPMRA